jgi:hypothetical protein
MEEEEEEGEKRRIKQGKRAKRKRKSSGMNKEASEIAKKGEVEDAPEQRFERGIIRNNTTFHITRTSPEQSSVFHNSMEGSASGPHIRRPRGHHIHMSVQDQALALCDK